MVTESRKPAPTTILAAAYLLQSDDVTLGCAPEKGITIIEARVDDGASDLVGTFCVDRASYVFEGPDVVECG